MTMRNLLLHPNVGGRVVVQLGCEKSQACLIVGEESLVPIRGSEPATPEQTPLITVQDQGGTWSTVEEIVRYVDTVVLPAANHSRRVLVPAAELVLAAQCGGSDAASGFTSNAAIGQAFDLLIRCGGTAFISETTETLSAGHLLTRRARSRTVAEAYLKHVAAYRRYLEWGHGTPQNNLAHGNMVGGLTTVAEKALGSVAKAGTTTLEWVCDYGERVPGRGLGFMNGPSFDPASATGQTAGGAQVGVFSTGRGSCFGGLLVPWIKVVSNTEAYERIEDMEINAGTVADGVSSIEEVGRTVFETVLAAASGAKTYSEKAGYAVVNVWDSGAVT
jgi:altronate hydrolase